MPFQSDEQRKAAFANMKNRRGGGGSHKKPPKPGNQNNGSNGNPAYGFGAVGYAGNFTAGLPNYANWYGSLSNTTQTPHTTSPGSNMPSGYGVTQHIDQDLLTREQFYYLRNKYGTLWTSYYDIMRGIVPESGQILSPQGTPGQLNMTAFIMATMPSDLLRDAPLTYAGNYPGYALGNADDAVYDQYLKDRKAPTRNRWTMSPQDFVSSFTEHP